MRPTSATAVLASPAVGARLRKRRGELRLSQREAARLVGVSLRGYQAWERGESGITFESLERLAAAFDVSEDWIGSDLDGLAAGTAQAMLEDIYQAVLGHTDGSADGSTAAHIVAILRDVQERLSRLEHAVAGDAAETAAGEIERAAADSTALLANGRERTPPAKRTPARRRAAS